MARSETPKLASGPLDKASAWPRVGSSPSGQGSPLIDLQQFWRESPPWLISAVVHMLALIILGLWLVTTTYEPPLSLQAGFTEELGEIDLESLAELSQLEEVTLEVDVPTFSEETFSEVIDPLAMTELEPVVPEGLFSASLTPATKIASALSGRAPSMRDALRQTYGGTPETEEAVLEGLKWLARNQRPNGSWSLQGPYPDGARTENHEAATAMALLAFQGHGHTHQRASEDPFSRIVFRGWNWLLKQQRADGSFYKDVGHGALYTQAQCTIALCELYGMTQDPEYRQAAQRAVDFCVRIQTDRGGWRYVPLEGEDLSVTGWFAMALQSARMAGLEVPSSTFERLSKYLDTVEKEYGSRYSYKPSEGYRPSMTAEGLLCRQYLGWRRRDERLVDGVAYLLENAPAWDERNVYYWYYATQVLHHMEGEAWTKWNRIMRQLLPDQQVQRGRERGSWDPEGDRWGSAGGRLYTTCLSIYILEVYYRHLPIYRDNASR